MLALSAIDREFESRSSQTKDYKIVICCFSTKYTRSTSRDWLARNRDNMSNEATFLPEDCCFSELTLLNLHEYLSGRKWTPPSHQLQIVLAMIDKAEKIALTHLLKLRF